MKLDFSRTFHWTLVILKEHSPDTENPIENVDAVEVIDSNIIDAIKTSRYRNKKRPDEKTILQIIYVKVIQIAM